jgi:aryl-alcohol dehydrogenase-like predicted oxidoreductase
LPANPFVILDLSVSEIAASTLVIGARNEAQLRDNLGAVDFTLSAAQMARLDTASERPPVYPYWHQRATFAERNPPPV